METIPPDAELTAVPRRLLTPRQEDGLVYKAMAFVVFALVGLPIGYLLTSGTGVPGVIRVLVGIFIFDAGWNLALLPLGRGDMLEDVSPRRIIGRALERTVPIGLVLGLFLLNGDTLYLAILIFVVWGVAPLLSARRAC